MRGQPARVVAQYVGKAKVAREVVPFVGIGFVVVELLGAVGVADISPALGTNRVAPPVVGGNGRPRARGIGVLELGHKAVAVKAVLGGQAAKLK